MNICLYPCSSTGYFSCNFLCTCIRYNSNFLLSGPGGPPAGLPPGFTPAPSTSGPGQNQFALPDLSKPPPGFPAGLPPFAPPPSDIDLTPSVPYFELPGGLMAPLVKVRENLLHYGKIYLFMMICYLYMHDQSGLYRITTKLFEDWAKILVNFIYQCQNIMYHIYYDVVGRP